MKPSTLIIAVLALAFAVSFGVVTRVINPGESVNALWLVVAAACFFVIVYRLYGSFIAAKILALDDRRITPAIRLNDGKDYHPTNTLVLFGHHFAAIAGRRPADRPGARGPVRVPAGFLWILIGAAFGGAVHDMVILFASVRRNGCSLAQMARSEVGPVAGVTAALAILFIIIVALAGLGLAVVNALYKSPWGTFTIFATIPIALLMGVYLYKLRPGKVAEVSVIGVVLLIAAVLGGRYVQGSFLEPFFSQRQGLHHLGARDIRISRLRAAGVAAARPRDYLSTYMKIGTVLMLAAGVSIPRAGDQDARGHELRRRRRPHHTRAPSSPSCSSR